MGHDHLRVTAVPQTVFFYFKIFCLIVYEMSEVYLPFFNVED